mgnify:CR=1 FL=1
MQRIRLFLPGQRRGFPRVLLMRALLVVAIITEDSLRAADIANAKALVAATGRDDTNILICLTAKALAPSVQVVGRVKQAENLKLMSHSGADKVVSPEQIAGEQIAHHITS